MTQRSKSRTVELEEEALDHELVGVGAVALELRAGAGEEVVRGPGGGPHEVLPDGGGEAPAGVDLLLVVVLLVEEVLELEVRLLHELLGVGGALALRLDVLEELAVEALEGDGGEGAGARGVPGGGAVRRGLEHPRRGVLEGREGLVHLRHPFP